MNKTMKLGLSAIAGLALAGFLCAAAPAASKAKTANTQSAAEAHTVSGKVTSIGKTSFTLAVASVKMDKESSSPGSGAKSMTFQVDGNTTIDGNLQVGVDADVTYRIDSGQYIAINVRVGQ
jgi:hypothetical protein